MSLPSPPLLPAAGHDIKNVTGASIPSEPSYIILNTAISTSLTTTSQTAVQNLSNTNCLAVSANVIRSDAAAPTAVAQFQTLGLETPPANLDYVGIIATNDFFVQIKGTGNTAVKGIRGKMYGYRATANADIFAALVQSEVLSA